MRDLRELWGGEDSSGGSSSLGYGSSRGRGGVNGASSLSNASIAVSPKGSAKLAQALATCAQSNLKSLRYLITFLDTITMILLEDTDTLNHTYLLVFAYQAVL